MESKHGLCKSAHSRVYTHDDEDAPSPWSHLLCAGSPNTPCFAICGAEPHWDHLMWYGTGSQRELDTAKVLPLCPKCAERVK